MTFIILWIIAGFFISTYSFQILTKLVGLDFSLIGYIIVGLIGSLAAYTIMFSGGC